MARWDNQRRSGNVDNRRGAGAAVGSGIIMILLRLVFTRFGIIGIVVLVGGYFALNAVGIDPLRLIAGMDGSQQQSSGQAPTSPYDDELAAVLGSTEDAWSAIFASENLAGGAYPAPTLVLFSGQVRSGCGVAGSAVGPFYCPADQRLYIDTRFFDELKSQFNAGGDFPRAYVVAHEVGHHVQTVTGTSSRVRAAQQRSGGEANALQVRMELQADCYAGLWASYARRNLDPGDIEEALTAASAIGDDALQRRAGGEVNPDSFTHGTSAQRQRWFEAGFQSGSYDACDTFALPYERL